MSIIKGKISQGLGESKNTIKEQMPYFIKCFPEIANCKLATINIKLSKPLIIMSPDFITEPLPWHPAFRIVKGGEIFKFLRIKLSIDNCDEVDAWIYEAQFSPYTKNPYYIEVLAPDISFEGSPDCSIQIISKCDEGVVVISKEESASE